jgi:2-polyprenyl-6-methoxyphenol hydroxylase-like FAD-dependent oxidoreductase
VLIVGAGLALARAVRQREIAVEIVERATKWDPTGTGLYLPGNGVLGLGELGVGPAVAARANPIVRQRFLDHRGRRLADIDVARFGTVSADAWRSIARRCMRCFARPTPRRRSDSAPR